jgi:GAF domain-containing protein
MSSALFQSSFSTTIVIVLIVLFLAAGVLLLLYLRSSMQKREQDGRARERILGMEREAQFAAAADRVLPTRNPADIALQIAGLLREYLSIQVIAVYAGRPPDSELKNVLAPADTGPPDFGLPVSVPASLLAQHSRPAVVRLAAITGRPAPGASVATEPQAEKTEEPANLIAPSADAAPSAPGVGELLVGQKAPTEEESVAGQLVRENRTTFEEFTQNADVESPDTVALLPWYGPFEWNGVIVSAAPEGIALGLFDPYREPLGRLTDRLAIALDFQRSDSLVEAAEQRVSRTADFSRSLIACLAETSPLDSIVREVARLVGSDSAALWRIDEASGMVRMVASHGLASPEFLPLPLGQGLAGHIAQTGEVLAIEDAPADPRCIFPREARDSGIISYLGAPLSADGRLLGVIEGHGADRRLWSEGDQRALRSAAAIIAELIRSTDSQGSRISVENAYMGLSESLQRLHSAEDVKEAVVEVLGHALAASRVMVVDLNDRDQPEPVTQEFRQPFAKSALGTTFGAGLLAAAAGSEADPPLAIAHSQEKSLAGAETAGNLSILSELAAPIRVDGKTRGIVYVHQCDRVREWEPEEVEFAGRVVRQLSLSLSNLRSLETAFNDAKQARDDAQRASEISRQAPVRIQELEQKLAALDRELTLSRSAEMEAREMFAKASALETAARAEADVARRNQSDVSQQLESLQEEHKQTQGSAQQLLEINRLKSEFIVNAGHEMEASLQSVLGLSELLERGSYGNLTAEQREAVRGIYVGARRLKSDIDWLVEYGSARSRRLESTGGQQPSE